MARLYRIPENFAEGGKVINGMFEIRKIVEGVAMAAAAALLILPLPLPISLKIRLILILAIPLLVIGVVGIMGDPVSVFVVNLRNWFKNRRIMLYNTHTEAYEMKIGDMLLATEQPVDKINQFMGVVQERLKNRKEDEIMIEGEDFNFKPEVEERYAQQNRIPKYVDDDTLAGLDTSLFDLE